MLVLFTVDVLLLFCIVTCCFCSLLLCFFSLSKVLGLKQYQHIIEAGPNLIFEEYKDDYIWPMAASLQKPENIKNFPFVAAKFVSDSSTQLIKQYVSAGADADILIGVFVPFSQFAVLTAAEALQKPIFFVTHDALNVPANGNYSYDPTSNTIKDHGWLSNLINSRVLQLILGLVNTISPFSAVRSVRSSLDLSTPYPFLEMWSPFITKNVPTFYTWDLSLWPAIPAAFGPWWTPTGYFVTPATSNTKSDMQRFEDFMKKRPSTSAAKTKKLEHVSGRPIFYISTGSFDHHDQTALTDIILDTLTTLDADAVVGKSSVDQRTELPPSVLVVSDVDHSVVMPHMTAVVFHGGAGTASQAIRSGNPMICMPAMHFQHTWCERLEANGLGRVLWQLDTIREWKESGKKVNRLTEAIRAVITPLTIAAAKIAGERAKAQGGVTLAADTLEKLVRSIPASSRSGSKSEL